MDRMLSFDWMSTRMKKWTSHVITHFFDVAIVNAWIQYHSDSKVLEQPEKQTKQYLDFKLDLAEELMGCDDQYSEKESSDDDDSAEYVAPPPNKRRMWIPQPEKAMQRKGASHMPEMVDQKSAERYRNCQKAKTRQDGVRNSSKMHLCLTKKKNCFKMYHH